MFLSLSFSFPSPLSENKYIKYLLKIKRKDMDKGNEQAILKIR